MRSNFQLRDPSSVAVIAPSSGRALVMAKIRSLRRLSGFFRTRRRIASAHRQWKMVRQAIKASGEAQVASLLSLASPDASGDPASREAFFDLAGRFSPVVAAQPPRANTVFVSTADLAVGRETFAQGLYDEKQVEKVLRVVAEVAPDFDSGDHRTVVEVGANIGTTTLLIAQHLSPSRIVAYEPDPTNAELLRLNLVANDLADVVSVRELAISDRAGTAVLGLSTDNHGDHRVLVSEEAGASPQGSARAVVTVELSTLDAALADDGVAIDDISLVWCDVQGHEGHMLAGAGRLLCARVPVVIEYWPYGLARANGLELLESMIVANYTTVVDMPRTSDSKPDLLAAGDMSHLRTRYTGRDGYTDLLLLK